MDVAVTFYEICLELLKARFRYWARPVEYVWDIESRRHSAKRPIIFLVTLLVGAGSSPDTKDVRSWKYRLRHSRRCNRTRHSRAFTAAWLTFSTCAVCSIESPSTSRSTKTVRKIGRNSSTVLPRMSRNSEAQHSCSGFGARSGTSNGSASASDSKSWYKETSLWARCFRSFISDWFTVMRISQVENCASSLNSVRFWKAFKSATWTASSESSLLRVTL